MMRRLLSLLVVPFLLAATTAPATQPAPPIAPKPVPVLSPQDEMATFQLPPGLKIELVACEPMVEHPVFATFDPDGRLWVAEMRNYMPNTAGVGEEKPLGRVSVLEDTDGDGRMDKSTVFLDKLVLPRAIGFVKDGVLIGTPPKLLLCRDRDGDLKSDEQRVVATDFGVIDNPENFANGLMWNLDNWIYCSDHDKRLRVRDGKLVWSPVPVFGQWGITRDDYGRLFFNTNSDYLRGAMIPPHYSARNPKSPIAQADMRIAKDQTCWPLHPTTVNRGYRDGFLREDGTLKEFTAACSPMIYRGDLFPSFYGNAFACEATSNFVRRAIVTEKDGVLSAEPAEKGREFLASTYERFRPVGLTNGPDGAIYVVDMHHGLIQHRISITEFAKDQYTKKTLHKNPLTGRIFRIVPEGKSPVARPRLSTTPTEQLVRQLTHPNGWWRDTAQRVLVERNDPAAVEPLRKLFHSQSSPIDQINALWTLEGMGRLDTKDVQDAIDNVDWIVKWQGVRLAEQVPADLSRALGFSEPRLQTQFVLTATERRTAEADKMLIAILNRDQVRPNDLEALVSGLADREIEFLRTLLNDPTWSDVTIARRAVLTGIAKSVVRRGEPREVLRLVDLVAEIAPKKSSAKDWRQLALLAAIPEPQRDEFGGAKVIQVAEKPAAVDKLKAEKVAALFQWPGKPMPPKPPVEPLTAKQQEMFEVGRQQFTAVCAQCHQKDGGGQPGKAPRLVNSHWVLGPQTRLIRIVLHGMRGPITLGGNEFEGDMPSWRGALTDDQIAGVLTYIRREWGHEATAIDAATVHGIRDWTQARRDAWTEKELLDMK